MALEAFRILGPQWAWFEPDDVVLVDWDNHPPIGDIGCRREGDRVRLVVAKDRRTAAKMGRLVRQENFLRQFL